MALDQSGFELRATTEAEYRAALDAKSIALLQPLVVDDSFTRQQAIWEHLTSYSAWADNRCVGHAAYLEIDTTVPGGQTLPTAGVTRVGIVPTHRRRGIASSLMRRLIETAVERDLAMMSLRASETTIYQRYGFGVAGDHASITIDPHLALPVRAADATGRIELLRPNEAVEVVAETYHRIGRRRPGTITRPRPLLEHFLRNVTGMKTPSHVAVHIDERGEVDGYVHYTVGWASESMTDGGTGRVHDLFGIDDSTELALWNFILHTDLVHRWSADERPIDDVLRYACRDLRAYRHRSIDDEQWLRLIDVDRSLSARQYRPVEGSVTIRITDELVASNNGAWRIDANGATRTTTTADLHATIGAVSAVYLGGRTWRDLVTLGEVAAPGPAAPALADALFSTDRAPFCGSFF